MNAQVNLSIDECFAALDYERKHNAELSEKLHASQNLVIKHKTQCGNISQLLRKANATIEKYAEKQGLIECDDKKILTEELTLNVKNRKDAVDLLLVLLKLQSVDRFWHVVRTQSLDSITHILVGMKTTEGYDLIVSRMNAKKITLTESIGK